MIGELAGDQAESAWSWFVDRYRSLIRAVLVQHLGSEADVALQGFWGFFFSKDIVQRVDRERSFRAFLRGVVRNYAKKWWSENAHRAGADPDQVARLHDAESEDEEVRLWAQHLLGLALRSLRSRHADSADVLEWFYGLGPGGAPIDPLPVAEIARRMECKTNAIHQALHRGRQRLRQMLESELREVTRPETLEDEVAIMFAAIGRARPGLAT